MAFRGARLARLHGRTLQGAAEGVRERKAVGEKVVHGRRFVGHDEIKLGEGIETADELNDHRHARFTEESGGVVASGRDAFQRGQRIAVMDARGQIVIRGAPTDPVNTIRHRRVGPPHRAAQRIVLHQRIERLARRALHGAVALAVGGDEAVGESIVHRDRWIINLQGAAAGFAGVAIDREPVGDASLHGEVEFGNRREERGQGQRHDGDEQGEGVARIEREDGAEIAVEDKAGPSALRCGP